MSLYNLHIVAFAVYLANSCAAPSEPAALSSSNAGRFSASAGTQESTANGATTSASSDKGGAPVGDADMQAAVKSCIDQGRFYDRLIATPRGCTAFTLANVKCKDPDIKASLSSQHANDYDRLKAGSLTGYTLDQCLDCSAPAGNPYCLGTNQSLEPGMRLYFVAQKEQGMIDIQTVYVPR